MGKFFLKTNKKSILFIKNPTFVGVSSNKIKLWHLLILTLISTAMPIGVLTLECLETNMALNGW
jgi:hypothetical protein